ncbi:MAG: transcriptional regulator BetI [Nitratireductor sp.]
MARIGAEPERRQSLIEAAAAMIGEQGSLDVTVKDIAARAGMSPALAFHYFGGKDEIITQTMRYLLREFSREVSAQLQLAKTPAQRVDAILRASFAQSQFDRNTVAAWLVFYLRAYSSPPAARLLHVYHRRLHSNLVHALSPLSGRQAATNLAEVIASLIDGIYIRHALKAEGRAAHRGTDHLPPCRQPFARHQRSPDTKDNPISQGN